MHSDNGLNGNLEIEAHKKIVPAMLHPFLVVEIHTILQLLGYRFPESKIFRRVDKLGKIY